MIKRAIVLLAAFAVVSSGCSRPDERSGAVGFDEPQDPAAGPATPAGPASPAGPGAVPAVLDFKAPRIGGGQVVGAQFAGKDVAAWFWAPW